MADGDDNLTFATVLSMAFDAAGNLYVLDTALTAWSCSIAAAGFSARWAGAAGARASSFRRSV